MVKGTFLHDLFVQQVPVAEKQDQSYPRTLSQRGWYFDILGTSIRLRNKINIFSTKLLKVSDGHFKASMGFGTVTLTNIYLRVQRLCFPRKDCCVFCCHILLCAYFFPSTNISLFWLTLCTY